jgi:Ca2+-dependent lipid-binding protein
MIKDMVEPMFADMLPGPLKTLHFTKIDLGTEPFVFDNADVHTIDTSKLAFEGDTVKVDLDVTWDSNMDVELDCDMLPGFGIQHIKFSGRLSVLLRPLVPVLPLVGAMQISFINPPTIEFDMTGLAQVADFAGVDVAVRGVVNSIIAGMLVLPNRMLIKVDPANDFYATYLPPLGFIRVKIGSGTGFTTDAGFMKDVPDLYCSVKFGANPEWLTSTKDNDETPQWNETHDFLLSDHDQVISIDVLDSDYGKDQLVGVCQITVGELLLAGRQTTLLVLAKDNPEAKSHASITLSCDIFDLAADPSSLTAEPVVETGGSAPSLNNGLLTILVAGAKTLPGAKADLQVQAKVKVGDTEFATGVVTDMPGVDVNNPCFDSAYRVLLTPEIVKSKPDVKVTLFNKTEELGSFVVPFGDVLASPELTVTSKHTLAGGGTLHTKVFANGLVAHQ